MNSSAFLRRFAAAIAAVLAVAGSAAETVKPELKIGYLPLTDHLTILAAGRTEFKESVVKPVKFSSWPELAEALKSGAVDGAFALTPIGITLRQKGIPVKAIFLGHRDGSALTVRDIPEIKAVADLKGRTIAIPSRFSTHNILLRKLLKENKMDADKDVKVVEMAPPEMVNAMATGRVDAFIVAEPFGVQAEIQKVGRALILSKEIWPNHICCVLNMRQEAIDKAPKAVQELVDALQGAATHIDAHPAEAADESKKFLGQKPEVILRAIQKPGGRVSYANLAPDMADFKATQDYLLEFGILKEGVDLNQYVDSHFAKDSTATPAK